MKPKILDSLTAAIWLAGVGREMQKAILKKGDKIVMKAIKVILISLMIVIMIGGLIGAVSSVFAISGKTIYVKPATLTQQDSCNWGVGYWHFVINGLDNASSAPSSIHVIWDKLTNNEADVPLYQVTGKVAHYYAYVNAGYKVTDATTVIYDAWDGEFNLSHVVCQDSVCPNGATAYKWSISPSHPKGYIWAPYPNTFKSWNQVSFTNTGAATIYNVTATITCKPVNVTVVDGIVNVGNIPAGGSAWSTDDFALITNMAYTPLPPPTKMIVWQVEYDDADGNHHIIQNVPKYCGEPIDCP